MGGGGGGEGGYGIRFYRGGGGVGEKPPSYFPLRPFLIPFLLLRRYGTRIVSLWVSYLTYLLPY